MSERDLLTACVIVGPRRERAAVALRSLIEQELDALEILLVDCSGPSTPPVEGSDSPRVRTLRLSAAIPFASARRRAVDETRTHWLAFIEEHCRAEPGWAAALLAAHREGWPVVGPMVASGNPGVGRSELSALAGYDYWAPPQRRREVEFLPYFNTSFEVARLRALGSDLGRMLDVETALHRRLRSHGARLLLEPAARIAHLHETTWRSHLRGTYWSSRVAARPRAEVEGWGPGRRLLYTLATPLIPALFLLRLDRRLRREERRRERALARRSLAFLYTTQLGGAFGQAVGLWLGVGEAGARRFTAFELDEDRPGGW